VKKYLYKQQASGAWEPASVISTDVAFTGLGTIPLYGRLIANKDSIL